MGVCAKNPCDGNVRGRDRWTTIAHWLLDTWAYLLSELVHQRQTVSKTRSEKSLREGT